jgi:GH18 family chitinase
MFVTIRKPTRQEKNWVVKLSTPCGEKASTMAVVNPAIDAVIALTAKGSFKTLNNTKKEANVDVKKTAKLPSIDL